MSLLDSTRIHPEWYKLAAMFCGELVYANSKMLSSSSSSSSSSTKNSSMKIGNSDNVDYNLDADGKLTPEAEDMVRQAIELCHDAYKKMRKPEDEYRRYISSSSSSSYLTIENLIRGRNYGVGGKDGITEDLIHHFLDIQDRLFAQTEEIVKNELVCIIQELRCPFEDNRISFVPIDTKAIFLMFFPECGILGTEITGEIQEFNDTRGTIMITLPNELRGSIKIRYSPNNERQNSFELYCRQVLGLVKGGSVRVIIESIDFVNYFLKFVLPKQQQQQQQSQYGSTNINTIEQRDASWVKPVSSRQQQQQQQQRSKQQSIDQNDNTTTTTTTTRGNTSSSSSTTRTSTPTPQTIQRPISHLLYKNISLKEAEELLSTKPVGSFLFRPSVSRGFGGLVCTWKFAYQYPAVPSNIFVHIAINEEGKMKDLRGRVIDGRLGNNLRIDKDIYSSLDDICANYMYPMIELVKKMNEFRSFYPGTRDEVEDNLRRILNEKPGQIAYLFARDARHPPNFVVYVLRTLNSTMKEIKMPVTPQGFKVFNSISSDLEDVLRKFKEGWQQMMMSGTSRSGGGANQ
jgi:hypothetical protein